MQTFQRTLRRSSQHIFSLSRIQSRIPQLNTAPQLLLRQPIRPFHPPRPRPFTFKPQTKTRNTSTSASSLPASKTLASQSDAAPSPGVEGKPWRPAPHRDPNEPVYEMYFTCNKCNCRSGHTVSKQGYHRGTTLVKCPECQVRHLISDHLKIFTDQATTLEDILRDKGQEIRRGTVDSEGDIELWDEESVARRNSETTSSEGQGQKLQIPNGS